MNKTHFFAGGIPVQEMERHGDHQSIPVYSIQAERSRSSTSSSGKLHF